MVGTSNKSVPEIAIDHSIRRLNNQSIITNNRWYYDNNNSAYHSHSYCHNVIIIT